MYQKKKISYTTNKNFFGIDDWWDGSIERYLKFKNTGTNFDVCLINYVYLSKAFKFLPKNTLKIIDTHDKFSERNNIFPNELRSDFFFTTKEEEARGLSRADLILAISNKEKMFFEKLTSKTIVALPHKIKITNS